MAKRPQLGAQLVVVVDAAVEDDRQLAVAHRLRAQFGQIDDRQSLVDHADTVAQPEPGAVRPARRQHGAHALERVAVDAPQLHAEAAHQAARSSRCAAAAATSASNNRGWTGPRSRVSACHWTPSTKRSPGSSIPSTVPSGAHATARRLLPSRSTAW